MRILPELVLTAFGVVVMLVDPLLDAGTSRKGLGVFALIGTLGAMAAAIFQIGDSGHTAWFGMVRVDSFSIFFHILIPAISAVCILASLEYLDRQDIRTGEYYGLILFGTVGMVLMSSAVELVLIFIALEISSISTYVLAGYRRRFATGMEASLKYFLLGSFATAFFLYGVALVFGATGSTSVPEIAASIADKLKMGEPMTLVYVATALMIIGLGFKIAAAPFHVWTPDVYEGSPAPVVALMSTGPKAAAFAVLLRVLFGTNAPGWLWLVWVAAALSMTIGNFGALMQNNVKRMLAYSSIAHAGYLLVAFAARSDFGIAAAIFYTASYAAMNVGAFAVVSHLAGSGESRVSMDDYAGLSKRSPLLAFTLTIFMLSLIGIPLTGGFYAKYYVFNAALQSNFVWLTIIGLVNSAVAAYYYLRVIVVMYMRDPIDDTPLPAPSTPMKLALVLAAIFTLYLGIFPGRVVRLAERGAADLTEKPTNAAAKPAAAVSASAATPGR